VRRKAFWAWNLKNGWRFILTGLYNTKIKHGGIRETKRIEGPNDAREHIYIYVI
jgi:hypothetical protein